MAIRIFISVAEDSADLHAAALVTELRARFSGLDFYGLTGPRLRAAKVETVYDFAAHAAMLSGIFRVLGRAWEARRAIIAAWDRLPPDLVILMDSSALHLPLARLARRRGYRVLYYIAPQTWASRAYRNRRLATDVERVACILPFEEAYFRRALVPATYVGHPLFESLRRTAPTPEVVAQLRRAGSGRPIVALLPGSRRHVIERILPLQLRVLRQLQTVGIGVHALVSSTSQERVLLLRRIIHAGGFAADILVDQNPTLLAAADLVLVASGTATLEVAYHRKPMIVLYDVGAFWGRLHRWLGWLAVKPPPLSQVNILANAFIVPEFMPWIPDTRPIAAVAAQLLRDPTWQETMRAQLDALVRPLENAHASARVADWIAHATGWPEGISEPERQSRHVSQAVE